ncbi:bacteriophage abortive infection AbiH family protein [Staphylococcus argenteus]|uniref:bacteriophage abortive infection AbiH family protein n=1 Tax=Staphylococcus argenteus TaxID=985002 RepID=UPI000B588BB8|nr:bacteriophage abortive infection AbiH family protein [Staphylococcus argenteus]
MHKLFIIGNGFDISHQLQTSYADFRGFLINEYKLSAFNCEEIIGASPDPIELPDGGIEYDEKEMVEFLVCLIDKTDNSTESNWSELEQNLAYLDFEDLFSDQEDHLDKDGDINYWDIARINEDISANLIIPTAYIKNLFSDWVQSIDINGVKLKQGIKELINNSSLFLSFNYTKTLEKVYKIRKEDICYIHGNQYEEIQFGHGDKKGRYYENSQRNIGSENNLEIIYKSLFKDTEDILQNHIDFFNSLNHIEEVYSYGFSYGNVDDIYIKTIIKNLNTEKVTWYFNNYDEENHEIYTNKIKSFGYKGNFDVFHIN